MATNTTNYNLKKPAQDDFYNVDDFNDNADIIDTQLKTNADAIDTANTNIESANTAIETANTNIAAANTTIAAVKTTADAAFPASDFTGANVLTKLAADNSVLPVANGGTGAASTVPACDNLGVPKFRGNNTYSSFNSYAELPEGHYQVSYNGLKSDDPFTITGAKRVEVFVTSNGMNPPIKGYFVYGIDTGSVRGLMYVGFQAAGEDTVVWKEIINDSILAAQVQSLLTGGEISVIKSIQRGTISLSEVYSATATISSVDTSKSVISYLGNVIPQYVEQFARVELTNSTTITAYRSINSASNTVVGFEVVEYY
ncbi:MAG: hypothetical protein LKJ25_03040 [Clostridia bacterium]|jgi:hypothetical protein|nr:hypothetical protein [Clostridia bacterium]